MSVLAQYFKQTEAAEAKKSTNGSVMSKYFTPPQTTVAVPKFDTKQMADELAQAVVEVFKDYGQKHNVKFRFTKKAGRPR